MGKHSDVCDALVHELGASQLLYGGNGLTMDLLYCTCPPTQVEIHLHTITR